MVPVPGLVCVPLGFPERLRYPDAGAVRLTHLWLRRLSFSICFVRFPHRLPVQRASSSSPSSRRRPVAPNSSRLFLHLHQMFRGPGVVGLHMNGVCHRQTSAHQPLFYALPYHFLKQATKHFPKCGFPPLQLADRAVVRHSFIQINTKIPAKRVAVRAPLLNLTL